MSINPELDFPIEVPDERTEPLLPRIYLAEDLEPEQYDQLKSTLNLLTKKPAINLAALRRFVAQPERFSEDSRWAILTNRATARSYYFDEDTNAAIRRDPEIQKQQAKSGSDAGLALRALRLELYMKRVITFRNLGYETLRVN